MSKNPVELETEVRVHCFLWNTAFKAGLLHSLCVHTLCRVTLGFLALKKLGIWLWIQPRDLFWAREV